MKKLILFVLATLALLMACGAPPPTRDDNANAAAGSVEQKNYPEKLIINSRIASLDRPTVFQNCTYFNQLGQPLVTTLVHFKTTSSTKSLEASTGEPSGVTSYFYYKTADGKNTYASNEIEKPDGTFGSSTPYEYGFMAGFGLDGYYQTNMPYFCSIVPMVWNPNSLSLTVDESSYSKQLNATKAQDEGKCVDSRLNVVPCSDQNKNPLTDKKVQQRYAGEAPTAVPTPGQ